MADAKEDEGTRAEENGETAAPLERSMSIQERRAVFEKRMSHEDGSHPAKPDHSSDEEHKSTTPPPPLSHHGKSKGEAQLQHSATFDLSDVSDDESKERRENPEHLLKVIKNLEEQLSESHSTRARQQREIASLHEELSAAKTRISVNDDAISVLQRQVEALQGQLVSLDNENSRLVLNADKQRVSVPALSLENLVTPKKATNNASTRSSSRSNSNDPSPTLHSRHTPHLTQQNNNTNHNQPPPHNNNTNNNTYTSNTNNNINHTHFSNHGHDEFTTHNSKELHTSPHSDTKNNSHKPTPPYSSNPHSHSNGTFNPRHDKLNHYNSHNNSLVNSRKAPSIAQSMKTLEDLQLLLDDMIKTATDQKSNVEILLNNVTITLSANREPMSPEETIYFKNERKSLEHEHARLSGVLAELREQKVRCDHKLEKIKQKLNSDASKSPHPPPSPDLEVGDLQRRGSHSHTPASYSPTKTETSPTRMNGAVSPYFYYENWSTPSKDKIELPPPPDRYSPSLHRLTSDHIQKFTPQFVPDNQKLQTFPKSPFPQPKSNEPTPTKQQEDPGTTPASNFEWNYYFSSRS